MQEQSQTANNPSTTVNSDSDINNQSETVSNPLQEVLELLANLRRCKAYFDDFQST